ncbi:MAG: bifunctional adenosylcobinamide kinase/adenosylcobinamide-phosphate guanylyltransferase [Alphaproteobacteria bacterium]|nr:bifunctional adenosylcobinamide kinase/adenosylcobinamide-phosphate guanylyltransferase [Alphaproteobacteria bacterium]
MIFILGGVRSGKSAYGLELANGLADNSTGKSDLQKIFVATAENNAENTDKSMNARIVKHQAQRGDDWHLAEIPLHLATYLQQAQENQLLLIDCMTLWLNNLLYHRYDIEQAQQKLLAATQNCAAQIIMVGQEIGLSPHHADKSVRDFTDNNGLLNQTLAKAAQKVYFICAGYSITLKDSDNI